MNTLEDFQKLPPPNYATTQDRRNGKELARLMHLMSIKDHAAKRPPLVVLEGPPMSGKTCWLNQLSKLFDLPQTYIWMVPDRGKRFIGRGLLVIERHGQGKGGKLHAKEAQRLDDFLSAEVWAGAPLECLTIIHTHDYIRLTSWAKEPAFMKSVVRIRLTR